MGRRDRPPQQIETRARQAERIYLDNHARFENVRCCAWFLPRQTNCSASRPTAREGPMMTVLTIFFPCSRFSWHSRVGSTTGRLRLRCAREWTILSMVVSVLAAWPTLVSADPITLDQDIRGVS